MPAKVNSWVSSSIWEISCWDLSRRFLWLTLRTSIRIHLNERICCQFKIFSHVVDVGSYKSNRSLESAVSTIDTVNDIFHSLTLIRCRKGNMSRTVAQVIDCLSMVGNILFEGVFYRSTLYFVVDSFFSWELFYIWIHQHDDLLIIDRLHGHFEFDWMF